MRTFHPNNGKCCPFSCDFQTLQLIGACHNLAGCKKNIIGLIGSPTGGFVGAFGPPDEATAEECHQMASGLRSEPCSHEEECHCRVIDSWIGFLEDCGGYTCTTDDYEDEDDEDN